MDHYISFYYGYKYKSYTEKQVHYSFKSLKQTRNIILKLSKDRCRWMIKLVSLNAIHDKVCIHPVWLVFYYITHMQFKKLIWTSMFNVISYEKHSWLNTHKQIPFSKIKCSHKLLKDCTIMNQIQSWFWEPKWVSKYCI